MLIRFLCFCRSRPQVRPFLAWGLTSLATPLASTWLTNVNVESEPKLHIVFLVFE
jgi:hypothetical protein